MKRKLTLCATAALLAFGAPPAHAWDEFGHVVVARIAWENMTPQARGRAIQILRGAPPGSGLSQGFPQGTLTPEQQMWMFVRASHWPDDIKSSGHPGHGFARGNRHFVNLFWEQQTDFGPITASTRPPFGELLNDLPGLRTEVAGSDPGQAAVALAWVVHLLGDVHQPLHSSSRITQADPTGDRGGNDFGLSGSPGNLHSYWDGVITRNHRRRQGESDRDYLQRVAGDISARNPLSGFATDLAV
ncbi:MAG TPA: S1/P1 nuclease, partial [Longimicrobium sp.]|nr:S1/P1 nuclease [Longimicrobium sp.]